MIRTPPPSHGTVSEEKFTIWGGVQVGSGNPKYTFRGGVANSAIQSVPLNSIELIGNIADGWKLIQALPLSVSTDEDGHYLLTDDIFCVFGEGDTLAAAQQDFVRSLIEYFGLVAEYDDEPSRDLLASLKKYLQPSTIYHG